LDHAEIAFTNGGHEAVQPRGWARLIGNVYHAHPLFCNGCGGPLEIVKRPLEGSAKYW
jgi:hypothetical protein